ncbi:hypothetical protein [Microbacterium paludicola]|uniref:Uncharacterized protein n=1 Tax=Microbacterium paludicola TaxID=300019 RepID=A0A4Y9FW24_9MICO|nr:hypothetical protein [Microbacterium paludicola]MBF0816263.1 hypothetical protein [Microbacterium paludicola]TFU33065.1 hypothetical protein E4U02_07565 [Microbacterium paludicola]
MSNGELEHDLHWHEVVTDAAEVLRVEDALLEAVPQLLDSPFDEGVLERVSEVVDRARAVVPVARRLTAAALPDAGGA